MGSIPTLGQPLFSLPVLAPAQWDQIFLCLSSFFFTTEVFQAHTCVLLIELVSLNFSSRFPSCQGPEIVQSLKVNRKCHAWVF